MKQFIKLNDLIEPHKLWYDNVSERDSFKSTKVPL